MTRVLSGKVALVTGASSGIGEAAALALALAEAGADVALAARRADRLGDLVKRIEALGVRALALPGDVVDEAVAAAAVDRTIAQLDHLDILINSAGILQHGGIETANLDEYRRVMDVNVMGTVYTCHAAIPHMRARGTGDIINISSLAGRKTGPFANAYAASKHACNAMTDSMRQEVGGYGIRVCTLMPGATTTEVANNISDPGFRAAMQAHVAKEGAVTAADIGGAIVFICALPRHVNVSEISIRPTIDTTP